MGKKRGVKVVFFLIILGILLLSVFYGRNIVDSIFTSKHSKSAFNTIILDKNVLISTEWKEIKLKDSLVLKNKNQHNLSISLDEPFEGDFLQKGVRIPSGEIVTPEVKLVDEEGREYPLLHHGFLGKMKINFAYQGSLPKDKIYKKVLIRSDFPIKSKEILWIYYNPMNLR